MTDVERITDVDEIRTERVAFEWALGTLVDEFEKKTGCTVAPSVTYRRRSKDMASIVSDPRMMLTVELGFGYDNDDEEDDDA